MTPDKRLDQIEPILADVVQKTDRLIESNGQILEIATRADSNAKIAAKGVADLTLEMRQRFDQVDQRFNQQQAQIDQRFDQVDQRFEQQQAQIDQRFDQVDQRFEQQQTQMDQRFEQQQIQMDQRFDQQQAQINDLRQEMRQGFQDVNRKFTQFEQTQHQILTLLLDRLK